MRRRLVHQYFVYLMTNRRHSVLYTGVTSDLHRRVGQHKRGAVPGFTKTYNCHCLVYFEEWADIRSAITREKQIKGWTRAKKDALVTGVNPFWKDLAAEWYTESPRKTEEDSPSDGT